MSALPVVPQGGYTLNKNAKTIQLAPEYAPSEGKRILRVVNASRSEAIYYAPGTEYTGNYDPAARTLAFTASTTGHSDNDELQIFIENTALPATETTQAAILGSPGTSPPALPGGATGFPGWFRWLGLPLGSPSDAAVTDPSLNGTLPALVKGVLSLMASRLPVTGGRLQVSNQHNQPLTSAQLAEAALATAAKQPAIGVAGNSSADVLSVQGVAGGTPLTVVSSIIQVTATLTRPSNNTQYATNDVVGESPAVILTFSNCARFNGGSGVIIGASHFKTSATTTSASFRLQLYNAAPAAIADNDPFQMIAANRLSRIGTVLEFAHVSGGTGSDSSEGVATFGGGAMAPFVCAAGSRSLFGIATAAATYTPVGAEMHTFKLYIQTD